MSERDTNSENDRQFPKCYSLYFKTFEPPLRAGVLGQGGGENVNLKAAMWRQCFVSQHLCRKQAEHAFGEHGLKHRAQCIFWGSLSSLSELFSAFYLFVKTHSPSLPLNSVRLGEFSSPKQCIPPVSYSGPFRLVNGLFSTLGGPFPCLSGLENSPLRKGPFRGS